jgi:hypothetical protein
MPGALKAFRLFDVWTATSQRLTWFPANSQFTRLVTLMEEKSLASKEARPDFLRFV